MLWTTQRADGRHYIDPTCQTSDTIGLPTNYHHNTIKPGSHIIVSAYMPSDGLQVAHGPPSGTVTVLSNLQTHHHAMVTVTSNSWAHHQRTVAMISDSTTTIEGRLLWYRIRTTTIERRQLWYQIRKTTITRRQPCHRSRTATIEGR